MYIETPRMIIRDFTPEDVADLHDIFGDDETMKNCEPAYDFEKTKEFLTSFCIGRKGAVAAVHMCVGLPPKLNGQRPMLRGSLSNRTRKQSAHLGKNTTSL